MLKAVGLNEQQERVYRALLEFPGEPPAALGARLALSAQEMDAALSSLETLGLVSRGPGSSSPVPAPPDVAVEALITRRQEELGRARLAAAQLAKTFRSVTRHSPAELVEVIAGREPVRTRFEQLQLGARKEVLVFDKPPYASPIGANKLELEYLGRGVANRSVYDTLSLEVPGQVEWLSEVVPAGEQARVFPGLPLKLAIADRKLGLVPISIEEPSMQEGALLVHPSGLLDALVALLETLWKQSIPIEQALLPPGEGASAVISPDKGRAPGPEDRRLLALMAAGLTDEAIARQLGIGSRTVRRRTSALMRALGVQTRFQAGLQAAKRGWL